MGGLGPQGAVEPLEKKDHTPTQINPASNFTPCLFKANINVIPHLHLSFQGGLIASTFGI
jgi:hypothetical protein